MNKEILSKVTRTVVNWNGQGDVSDYDWYNVRSRALVEAMEEMILSGHVIINVTTEGVGKIINIEATVTKND